MIHTVAIRNIPRAGNASETLQEVAPAAANAPTYSKSPALFNQGAIASDTHNAVNSRKEGISNGVEIAWDTTSRTATDTDVST